MNTGNICVSTGKTSTERHLQPLSVDMIYNPCTHSEKNKHSGANASLALLHACMCGSTKKKGRPRVRAWLPPSQPPSSGNKIVHTRFLSFFSSRIFMYPRHNRHHHRHVSPHRSQLFGLEIGVLEGELLLDARAPAGLAVEVHVRALLEVVRRHLFGWAFKETAAKVVTDQCVESNPVSLSALSRSMLVPWAPRAAGTRSCTSCGTATTASSAPSPPGTVCVCV